MLLNTGVEVESWKPGCLIQDDEDVAYEPDDRQGKALALYITFKIRLLLHKTKFAVRTEPLTGTE